MYGLGLKSLAGELGLKLGNGTVYGTLNNFACTLSEGMGYKTMVVHLGNYVGSEAEVDLKLDQKRYRIQEIHLDTENNLLHIDFVDTIGTMKRIRDFIKTELPILSSQGFRGTKHCIGCGELLDEGDTKWGLLSGAAYPMHSRCANDFQQKSLAGALGKEEDPYEKYEHGKPLLGLLGAILGGLIGTIPWIIASYLGYYATIAGIAIVFCAQYGHKLFGGKPGKGRMAAVIFVTIVMIFVAHAASTTLELALAISDGSLAQSWGVAPNSIVMADLWPIIQDNLTHQPFLEDYFRDLGLGYLFGLLGFVYMWRKLKVENIKTKPKFVAMD